MKKFKKIYPMKVGNIGVKGYEVLIQKHVEECLALNGWEAGMSWWQIPALRSTNIFMEVYNAYEEEPKAEVIVRLHFLCEKIEAIVNEFVAITKPCDLKLLAYASIDTVLPKPEAK